VTGLRPSAIAGYKHVFGIAPSLDGTKVRSRRRTCGELPRHPDRLPWCQKPSSCPAGRLLDCAFNWGCLVTQACETSKHQLLVRYRGPSDRKDQSDTCCLQACELYGFITAAGRQELGQMPGVLSASRSDQSRWRQQRERTLVSLKGNRPTTGGPPSCDRVGPRYFETIGTRLGQAAPSKSRDTLHPGMYR